MRLLTLDKLQDAPPDAEFAPSSRGPVAVCLVCSLSGFVAAGLATGVIPQGRIPAQIFWALTVFLFIAAALGYLAARSVARSKFWLCRTQGNLLWIRCSHKQNALVVELDRSELAWVQPLKLTYVWKGMRRGGREYEFYRYIEMGLSEPAAELLGKFAGDERIAKDMREEIAPAANVMTMPARMIRGGVIRLCWMGISPGLNAAGNYLSGWTELRPLRRERQTND